jgi:hypothetical protein
MLEAWVVDGVLIQLRIVEPRLIKEYIPRGSPGLDAPVLGVELLVALA